MYSYTSYFVSRSRLGCPVSATSYDHVTGVRRASSEERYQKATSRRSQSPTPTALRLSRAVSELTDTVNRRERAKSLSRISESAERSVRASSVESCAVNCKSEEKTTSKTTSKSDDYLNYLREAYLSPYDLYHYRAPYYHRTYYTFFPDGTFSIKRTPRMFTSRYYDLYPYSTWRSGYKYPSHLSETYLSTTA